MIVNLLNAFDLSSSVNNKGIFSSCDFVGYNDSDKTNSINKVLLNDKSKSMDNKQLIEVVKSILNSKYGGDIEKLSNDIGMPSIQLYNYLMHGYGLSEDSIKTLESYVRNQNGDKIIMGDNIEGDKIMGNKESVKGDQYNISFCSESEIIVEENRTLKDEIKSLKEVIRLLKKKK